MYIFRFLESVTLGRKTASAFGNVTFKDCQVFFSRI